MPKIMIEIDLPDGQKIPTAEDIKRLTDPDWISNWWHIDDVLSCDWDGYEVTDDDCREVLRLALWRHDANEGLNWEVMQVHVDSYLNGRIK